MLIPNEERLQNRAMTGTAAPPPAYSPGSAASTAYKPMPTGRPPAAFSPGSASRPTAAPRTPGTGGVARQPLITPPRPTPGPTPGQSGFVPQWFQRAHPGAQQMDLATLWAQRNARLAGQSPAPGGNIMTDGEPTVSTGPLPNPNPTAPPVPPAFGGQAPGAAAGAPGPAFQGFGWGSLNGNQAGGPQGLPALDANGLPQYATQAQGVQTAWDMGAGANRGQLRRNPQTGAMEILMGSGMGGESYAWQPYDQGNLGQRQNAELFQRYGPSWSSGSGATSMHSADIAQVLTEQLGRQPTQQEVYDQYYGVAPRVQGIAYNNSGGYAPSGSPLPFGGG
jgi:hypothetical protein